MLLDNALVKTKSDALILRVAQARNTTLSHLYIRGLFSCYLLEDSIRKEKVAGETCIPEGEYNLRLNRMAAMNATYAPRYGDLHRGMMEISGIPNFQLVFIHIGNYHTQTRGCPLTGSYYQLVKGDYHVLHSAVAYRKAYTELLKLVDSDALGIEVRNMSHLLDRGN